MSGLFITIEGIDGCGKSVQSARLAHWLESAKNRVAVRTVIYVSPAVTGIFPVLA